MIHDYGTDRAREFWEGLPSPWPLASAFASVMREGEDSLMWLDALEIHHRTQLLFEEWRHLNYASGRARLGRARLVAASDLRDASPHHDDTTIEIDVVAREREQFSQAQAAPVENLECAVRDRVVLDLLREGEVLRLRPEAHLLGLLLSHLAKPFHGVSLKLIEVGHMVQDRIELVVDGPEISWRIASAFFSARRAHEVFPKQYVLRGEPSMNVGPKYGSILSLKRTTLFSQVLAATVGLMSRV